MHVRYAVDAMFPWVGRSPLRVAMDAGKMAAGAERSVAEEISTTTGHVLAHPENTTNRRRRADDDPSRRR